MDQMDEKKPTSSKSRKGGLLILLVLLLAVGVGIWYWMKSGPPSAPSKPTDFQRDQRTQPIKIPKPYENQAVMDYNRLDQDSTLQDLMDQRKKTYGVEEGLIYSFPVTCEGGNYTIVQGLEINDFSQDLMNKTEQELREERDAVADLLP